MRFRLPLTFLRSKSTMASSSSRSPAWLDPILRDTSPAPTLYAWTPANLGLPYSPPTSSISDESRRIHVVGVGNIGRLFAAYIGCDASKPITLVVHRKTALEEWKDGLQVTNDSTTVHSSNFRIEYWSEEKPESGPVAEVQPLRNVIVSTKANAALPAVDRARRYLSSQSTVAFAQNGISRLWPPHGLTYMQHRWPAGDGFTPLLCVATHGVFSEGPFKSRHAAMAGVYTGFMSGAPRENFLVDSILAAEYLNAEQHSPVVMWMNQLEKLVINACLNPLTALLRQKNGIVVENEDGGIMSDIIDRITTEIAGVYAAYFKSDVIKPILATATDEKARQDIEQMMATRFNQPALRQAVYTVGRKVKENKSSMFQDVAAGKPTEIADINGWLVDTASFLDPTLDVTVNRKIVQLIEGGAGQLDMEALGSHLL